MRSASVTELFEADFNFARLRKDGSYEGHKKRRKDTTHLLEETKLSIVATPLKRWPKHQSKNAGYGKPRYMQVPFTADNQPAIPAGATHLEYSTSRVALVADIKFINDFSHMRGKLRFGKYHRQSDRFEYLDNDTPLADGVAVMASEHRSMKPLERVVREEEAPAPIAFELGKPAKGKTKFSKSQPSDIVVDELPKLPRVPRPAGGESVCGFIDGLIAEGGRTKEEVLALVLAKFPGRDSKATMSTIGVRPSHMRAAGKTPQPFKK